MSFFKWVHLDDLELLLWFSDIVNSVLNEGRRGGVVEGYCLPGETYHTGSSTPEGGWVEDQILISKWDTAGPTVTETKLSLDHRG